MTFAGTCGQGSVDIGIHYYITGEVGPSIRHAHAGRCKRRAVYEVKTRLLEGPGRRQTITMVASATFSTGLVAAQPHPIHKIASQMSDDVSHSRADSTSAGCKSRLLSPDLESRMRDA